MSTEYSPEVQAFIDQLAKDNAGNGIRFNPDKVRLIGRDPNKPNPDKMGKLFIKSFDEKEKKYGEEIPFGPAPHQSFSAIILETLYYAKWKYKENSPFSFRTREFKEWRGEPVELLKMTYDKEKTKTETAGTFHDYSAFKAKFSGVDEMGIPKVPPYNLFAAIYVWHPSTDKVLKYEITGPTRSAFFDYDKAWKKALPNAKALLQIITKFGVTEDEKGFTGSFMPGGMVAAGDMQKVMEHFLALQEWRKSWKKANAEEPKTEELPTINVSFDEQSQPPVEEPWEPDLSNIPF